MNAAETVLLKSTSHAPFFLPAGCAVMAVVIGYICLLAFTKLIPALAYGLAATVLWVLGIPHAFALMHGKTRRGALVFDVADLIKDAVVLPWSFICAEQNYQENDFRKVLISVFTELKILDFMFDTVQQICLDNSVMETKKL